MHKSRLEAFSDGVFAILITIMVLEMKVPHGADWQALKPVLPVFLSYILSFIYIGIYWNNHHHMLQAASHVNGQVLWANTHLLFWQSLIPFVSGWMGENNFATVPVALYGTVLIMNAIAYTLLSRLLISLHGKDSLLATAIGKDWKGVLSLLLYGTAIPFAFIHTAISMALFTVVALIWFIPDRRIEKKVKYNAEHQP